MVPCHVIGDCNRGGRVGDNFLACSKSEVNISGSSFGDSFTASNGSGVNLFGTEFFLDGVRLDTLSADTPFKIDARDVVLSGVLADGSPFSLDLNSSQSPGSVYFQYGSSVSVILVPESSSLLFMAFDGFTLAHRRSRM